MEMFRELKNLLLILEETGLGSRECYSLSLMELDDAEKRIVALEERLSRLSSAVGPLLPKH